ncbi:MAG: T9SS type A sorting domain-containing protein [Candidatus Delongbacteria bacterium]|nr:T9SS type A sorting domain-containing protein [Candidatus Delongbacteria bacterium]
MKHIIYFIMISLSISFSQGMEWSNTISLSTEENGVKQIDTDENGNIYIAGYYGAPNYANWDYGTYDSLISSPDIRLLKLSSSGELIFDQDYGKLFHNLAGMTNSYQGLKLIGNTDSGYNPLDWTYYSIATGNEEGTLIDTVDYIPYYQYGDNYRANYVLPTTDGGYIYSYSYYGFEYYNGEIVRISPIDSLNNSFPRYNYFPPDSLSIYGITDFFARDVSTTNDNGVILTGYFGEYLGYYRNFIIKLDDSFDVDWQLFYPYEWNHEPDETPYSFGSIESINDSSFITTCWIDINQNQDDDDDEIYLLIMNNIGEYSWSYGPFTESIKVEKMSHKDFIVRGLDTNTIWKFRYNGTGMDLLWSEVFPDLDILKVVPEGFINATIINDDLYVFKVKDDTSINNEQLTINNFRLEQNYPNPFNPVTTISYSISEKGLVNLVIYNTKGEVVSELVNKEQNIGYYNINFEGNDLNSGVYFYQLKLNNKPVDTKRMLLIK